MADRLSHSAARAPRTRDETGERGVRRRVRASTLSERDFAELEALLAADLRRAPSPSIAAGHDDAELEHSESPLDPAQAPPEPKPLERKPPDRVEPLRGGLEKWPRVAASNSNNVSRAAPRMPRHAPHDFSAYAEQLAPPEPGAAPRLDPVEEHAAFRAPHAERQSRVSRAMRVGATAFSAVALLGVSALLILLALGGERTSAPVVQEAAEPGETQVARIVSPPPARQEASAETGPAVVGRDMSRIPAPNGGGTVRAAVPGQSAEPGPFSPVPQQTRQSVDSAPATPPAVEADAGEDAPAAPPAAPLFAAAPAPASSNPASNAGSEPVRPAAAETERSATVSMHVNMRASPDNDAAVVAVVPAGKSVGIVACDRWCEVTYDGQQGFVFRKFVSGAGE